MEAQLRILKLKRTQLFAQVDMLSTINESLYLRIVKIEVDIYFMERKILQENKNQFDED